MPLSASRSLALEEKGRLDSAYACSFMLYESETGPLKEEDVIRLERNGERMIRLICNVRLEDRLTANELRFRLKLNSIWECLQDRRLRWFGHLERMVLGVVNVVSGSFPRRPHRKK